MGAIVIFYEMWKLGFSKLPEVTPTMILGWIATACTLVGFFMITYDDRTARLRGFLTCALGDILWILWALILSGFDEGMPIVVVNVALFITAIIGIKENIK